MHHIQVGGHHGRQTTIASLLAAVAMVLLQLALPAGASATNTSSLAGNPLLVPSGNFLFVGQQAAAETARRASPQAVFARERSKLAYVHLAGAGVGRLLERSFPAVMDHPSDALAEVPRGARVTGYASTHALELSLPGHRLGIVESSLPLATHSAHGRFSPIDLTLRSAGGGYAPVNSSLAVRIPSQIADGVGIPEDGVTVTPVEPDRRAARAQGALIGSAVVYAGSQPDVDTIVKPTVDGFQIDAALRSVDSPQKLYFKVSAPAGSKLVEESRTGLVNIVRAGRVLATVQPPGAVDAAGTAVPTSMGVSGHLLVVSVAHRSGSYLYPIDVDPEVNDSQLATTSGGKRGNWVFKTTSEARFGHAAVYEGSGKERLETTGIAEYVGTEYAYWGYETKGNSKIYELKTKTSAKNKGAKIESFLQFSTGATNENAKTLSTEASESEYSEKVSTICAWNASKVEECLPTAGKEKNGIRLQQSATGSPGAGFKFSDTMSEGIVSISEPSGQHSTTSFNTTSPELEGEVIVEGKKVTQKRENALYGAGIWITNAKGALQPIAKDPGIGVSATRFEYEKSSGVWETLSEHNYLNENGCMGVQCFPEHTEFWTLDPKLPNGEDKIRYRAEEAISGTVSLTSEGEKIVRVDTVKPHNIYLQGLPSGQELTEHPYTLTAEATDGEEKVISSGMEGVRTGSKGEVTGRGLRLLVDGKEVTETGTQTGCTAVKGPCTSSATWSINGGELPAGHHAIVVVATDNAGNEAEADYTFSVRHSTPVALGPGSVDLQSGDFSMSTTDVDMGSGLTVGRDVSSRSPQSVLEGPLGRQWSLNLGTTEHLEELANKSVLLTDERGEQTIFASLGGGEFEAPYGDSNLKLKLEENKTTKEKLAYYLEDASRHAKTKFTLPNVSTTMWVPTMQEGTVASDTVTYKYQATEALAEYAAASGSAPTMVAAGTDGAVWFVNANGGIGRATSSGAVTEYHVPLAPTAIAVSAKGEIWFTTFNDKIGRMTTGGVLTQYSVNFWGLGITVGPENTMWFTNYNAAGIGKITESGSITEYEVPGAYLYGITYKLGAGMWATDYVNGAIYQITPSTGAATKHPLPAGTTPYDVAVGPESKLWVTSRATNKIYKVSSSTGNWQNAYSVPAGSEPYWITTGPDKNLWYTQPGTSKVGKMSASTGAVLSETSFSGGVTGIAVGPEDSIWITSETGKKLDWIGTITQPSEIVAPIPAGVACSPMKAGCRALKFTYATSTTATGEGRSEWGEYKGRLQKILLNAYNPVTKAMQETAVSEYSYDKLGRLRAQWDPRISPALKTTYGYDSEGHVTSLTPPGQESWGFIYGSSKGDVSAGRLIKVARASAGEALWAGEAVKNTELPKITGSAVDNVRLAVSDGKWSGSPIAYGYQWDDCSSVGLECAPIPGATNANYTPVPTDVGHELVAYVTATNGDGSVTAASAATAVVEMREFTEFPLASGTEPLGITAGPDGNMWFTEGETTPRVAEMSTNDGPVTEYSIGEGSPQSIAVGSDKELWLVQFLSGAAGAVDHISTGGSLTKVAVPRSNTQERGIAQGPEGNMWFTETGANYIGKMNAKDQILAEYALPASSGPYKITSGPDGNLWFTDNTSNKIGKITPSGTVTEYALGSGKPLGIVAGPDGNLWFTDNAPAGVGKITTAGVITTYALPEASLPRGIVSYSGSLWLTEAGTSKIAKVTTAGVITEYGLKSSPDWIATGPDGNLWVTEKKVFKILRFDPTGVNTTFTEGEVRNPTPGYVLEYGTPLSGSGLPAMTGTEVAKWGQVDNPVEATAIMPPDAKQGWPATSYARGTVYYLDAEGRRVNQSSPSKASYGSVSTTEYNEYGDVVRTLSPDNRQTALEAGSKSVDVAKSSATYYSYRSECSKESENNHETESLEPGTRLCDVEGPQHEIQYVAGKEHREALGRLHTKYFYDENDPGGETHNLVTRTSTVAELAEEEVEARSVVKSYAGQTNLGWKLRAPTSVTIRDNEGKEITSTDVYNSETGQILETRSPKGAAGSSPHDQKIVYYSAEANTEGFTACGSHPEWAGLVCETLPGKQPVTSPSMPVIVTTYNIWNQPETVTETFGSTARVRKNTYDGAGRLTGSEVTSTTNVALPKVTNEYNSSTGVLEKTKTTVEGKTQSLVAKTNTLGQVVEYTDADGNVAKYRYGGPENDWLLEEVADGSNGGTGKQTYSYDSTTKQRTELIDSAAGTFTASYDAEGHVISETYPNAMCANTSYNSVGEAIHLEYLKTSNCSEHSAPVWFNEARTPAVRGEILARSSTLSAENYYYDGFGRLVEAQETPTGEGCSVRLYGYDEEANRTSQTTRVPGTGGKCATSGGTLQEHTYDEANRITDSGTSYDSFGNITKVPASDAEGHELASSFYVDNAVASQTQNGVTDSFYLDPEGRIREMTSGLNATVNHYDAAGSAVAWTSETGGKSTRNIPGITGALVGVQANEGTAVLQLRDLQGNVTATAALSPTETKLLSTYNNTEFGVPNKGAPPKFSWLGAVDISSAFSSGVITYGVSSYVPQIAMPLQSESVEAPSGIAPGGSGMGSAYIAKEEPWMMQAAAAVALEAPGREAAREREAQEAAEAAAKGGEGEGGDAGGGERFIEMEAEPVSGGGGGGGASASSVRPKCQIGWKMTEVEGTLAMGFYYKCNHHVANMEIQSCLWEKYPRNGLWHNNVCFASGHFQGVIFHDTQEEQFEFVKAACIPGVWYTGSMWAHQWSGNKVGKFYFSGSIYGKKYPALQCAGPKSDQYQELGEALG